MESVEKHIEVDKKILEDPTTNPQQRRHIESELHDLHDWVNTTRKRLKQVIITILHHLNYIVTRNLAHQNVKFTIINMLDQFTVILNSDGTFNIMVDGNIVQTNLPASELSQVYGFPRVCNRYDVCTR